MDIARFFWVLTAGVVFLLLFGSLVAFYGTVASSAIIGLPFKRTLSSFTLAGFSLVILFSVLGVFWSHLAPAFTWVSPLWPTLLFLVALSPVIIFCALSKAQSSHLVLLRRAAAAPVVLGTAFLIIALIGLSFERLVNHPGHDLPNLHS